MQGQDLDLCLCVCLFPCFFPSHFSDLDMRGRRVSRFSLESMRQFVDGGLSVQTLLESGYVVGATLPKTDTQASSVSLPSLHNCLSVPFLHFTPTSLPVACLLMLPETLTSGNSDFLLPKV